MTDPLPDLPGRLPEVPFRPTDERYAVARASAGRRRRRQAAVAGGGATLAAVLLTGASLLGGPSGPQVLEDATPPRAVVTGPDGEPSPADTPTPATPSPTATAEPAPDVTASGSTTAGPSSGPEPTGRPEVERTGEPGEPPADVPLAGPEPTTTDYDSSRVCDGSGPTPPSGWCSYYDGDRSAVRGGTAELAAAVCRLPGQSVGTLRSEDGQYATFFASTDDGVAWSWGSGKRFTSAGRDFRVEPGRCLRLAVTWDLVGDDGDPLPAGDYDADARPALAPSAGASVNTMFTFTIR